MRNKHNEGYTLPLVMVVLLVLAIVAVTIMTTSLKNMLRQQSFIEQMQAQYDAQGKIEMIVAQMENLDNESVDIPFEVTSFTGTTLQGSITANGTSGDSHVTIVCGIEISATEIKQENVETNSFIITGTPVISYTSYEIIKGGGS